MEVELALDGQGGIASVAKSLLILVNELTVNNLFANVPADLPEELVETRAENEQCRIERIISTGHASPPGFWYDQMRAEWVVVLKGEANLLFDGAEEPIHMKPGDYINIPAHERHRVEWTTPEEPTIWLAIYYG